MSEPDDTSAFGDLGLFLLIAALCLGAAFLVGYFIRMQTEPLSCAQQEAIKKQSFVAGVYKLNQEWCANNKKACRLYVMDGK